MMKYEDVTVIEDGLKAMLEDEEKGIAEYEKKIQEASRLGAVAIAGELHKIKQQESMHADTLRILIGRAEFAKFGLLPGQETGAVMESHSGALKTGNRVTVKTLNSGTLKGKIIGFERGPKIAGRPKRAIISLDDGRQISSVLEFVKLESEVQGVRETGRGGYVGVVRESRYPGVQRRMRY